MEFVLDASIAAAWIFEDERSELADEIIDSLAEKTAVAPPLWALETGNILLVSERRGRIDAAKRKLMLDALGDLGVIEEPQPQGITFGAVPDLAARHCLSSYDAAYLELAIRLQLPLATLDESLRKAAEQENVPLIELV
jgi:predicted nucleic acid-binding protein